MTITEFLEARIAEDEKQALKHQGSASSHGWGDYIARVLAECAAKRAIIELVDQVEAMEYQITNEWGGGFEGTGENILQALAAAYKDHADYQQEWAL